MIDLSQELKEAYPGLGVRTVQVDGIEVNRESKSLEEYKEEVINKVKSSRDLSELMDDPIYRKYRDFLWRIGIDPTKVRPASEALVRRILQGKSLPKINTAVDAYNMASIISGVPIAALDADKIEGKLEMDFSRPGMEFSGIGMKEPKVLKGRELIIKDSREIVAIYLYRDADKSKITGNTRRIFLIACGVPGIGMETLDFAISKAEENLNRFCR